MWKQGELTARQRRKHMPRRVRWGGGTPSLQRTEGEVPALEVTSDPFDFLKKEKNSFPSIF